MNVQELRRSAGSFAAITRGRLNGKTYVPHPRHTIFIETSARCNLACRFCAYAKQPPGGFMTAEMFNDVTDQIVDLGFSHVWLTPMLGELFADPNVMERFSILDSKAGIDSYGFYSNFILPRTDEIAALPRLSKLGKICISIYGLDENDFVLTTRKPAKQFQKLLTNLQMLFETTEAWRPAEEISFSIRTRKSAVSPLDRDTPMAHLLRAFNQRRGTPISVAQEYDSWGGVISPEEIMPLGLDIVDGRRLHMHGACVKVFSEVQVLADGRVHACACRDVDGSLMIGDVREHPLAHILSLENPRYRTIIETQMKGKFSDNCRSCSHYRSVYDDRAARSDSTLHCMPFADACRMLTAPC